MLKTTFEKAFNTVKELVADFEGNKNYYLTPAYFEQAARHDFIDKFFIAHGWGREPRDGQEPLRAGSTH